MQSNSQKSAFAQGVSDLTMSEHLNFVLTNRVPRYVLTRIIGWISEIENRHLARLLIWVWKKFAPDLDFTESKKTQFSSLRECFIRELKADARKIQFGHNNVTSPCDAIIGEFGDIRNGQLFQAKGFPYQLKELIQNPTEAAKFVDGRYITLRLKSSMYHRFHAPIDGEIEHLTYISGDTYNVNPVALKKIPGLFCLNERAVLPLVPKHHDAYITLVPIAAILVASMKFHCIDQTLDIQYRGPNEFDCAHQFNQGQEMGYFQHGSTIILFASKEYRFTSRVQSTNRINMGETILEYKPDLTL